VKGADNMKCVKKLGMIRRVHDFDARTMVENEGWAYCPKSEWKAATRDATKEVHKQSKKGNKKKDQATDSGQSESVKE
jgi:hypothetical protein